MAGLWGQRHWPKTRDREGKGQPPRPCSFRAVSCKVVTLTLYILFHNETHEEHHRRPTSPCTYFEGRTALKPPGSLAHVHTYIFHLRTSWSRVQKTQSGESQRGSRFCYEIRSQQLLGLVWWLSGPGCIPCSRTRDGGRAASCTPPFDHTGLLLRSPDPWPCQMLRSLCQI